MGDAGVGSGGWGMQEWGVGDAGVGGGGCRSGRWGYAGVGGGGMLWVHVLLSVNVHMECYYV